MKRIPWIIAALAAALYCSFSVTQWNGFISPSWDLGIFTQLANQYAHFNAPIVDIKGPGYNLLGDHFHPILILLGPVFRLFPSGLTLLILQNLLFAWSSVPITRLASQKFGAGWGAALGVSYALSWGLLEAIAAQFHEIAFAVPLLAFGLVHWIEGRKRAYIEIGLLAFVKEDLGLTVAAFGFVMLLSTWGQAAPRRSFASLKKSLTSRQARNGWLMICWGFFWFVASIWIILPLLNPGGVWDYTGRLSETSFFAPAEKYVTLALLLASAGIIGIRSPLMLLMIPTLLWRFAGNVPYYWGWEWHYSAILMPIAAVSLIDGLSSSSSLKIPPRTLGALGISLSLLTSLAMAWTGPVGSYVRGNYYVLDQRAGEGAVNAVRDNARVVSDFRMLAYLVPGNTLYWEGTVGDATVDTAVISPGHSAHSQHPEEWASKKFGGTWKIVYDQSGFTVLERIDLLTQ
ncbi:DUF2079 domain-containing protein [Ancrocorticia populi]|uniref:DUF2079 domain-containing protein n=1 Tax=Ancrocorticia populi TaxID=2175228 RepID=UPI001402DEFA|nr:DUF2079 domain-containing protein [Ancrocorticia populi]